MIQVLDEITVKHRLVVVTSHGGATTDMLRTLFGDEAVIQVAPTIMSQGIPGGAHHRTVS